MSSAILVTGANKGIGYEAVKLLSQRKPDSTILLGSRSTMNGNDAITKMKASVPGHSFDNVKVIELDITSPSSLSSAVKHVKSTYKTLDVLLHNSGISQMNGDYKAPEIFDVNVRGAHDTIEAFEPVLTTGKATVILVSSEVGPWYMKSLLSSGCESTHSELDDIANVTWEKVEGWMKDWDKFGSDGKAKNPWTPLEYGIVASKYCVSKALINPWARNYAANHPEIKVAIVCPGYCATDLNNNSGPRPASIGGESVVWPIFNEFQSGAFYQDGKQRPYTTEMSWEELVEMSKVAGNAMQ